MTAEITNSNAFDYAVLPAETAESLRAREGRMRAAHDQALVNIGKELAEAQAELANHAGGIFIEWATTVTGASKSSIYRLIDVYKQFGSRPNLGQLPLGKSALFLLSAPSVPDEVRDDVIARAESGEQLTVAAVKEAIADAKPKAEPEAAAAEPEAPEPPADNPHNPEADKASLRILLGLADGGKLHRMVLVRQALDVGLTNAQVIRALQALIAAGEIRMDGLICVLVAAESAIPLAPPPALDPRATIRVLLAGGPVKRADLWRQFSLQDPKQDYGYHLREMVNAGEVTVSETGGTYALATPAPEFSDAAPGETTPDPTPTVTPADTNIALLDRAAFERGLLDLRDQIPGAMRIQGIRSWAALDLDALLATRALIMRTLLAVNDLRAYLALMDTRLNYMIEHHEPYPDPAATLQPSPLVQ
jgi:hypothetical protein